ERLELNAGQPLLVAGLASDKAKLLRWRSEQIVLPASLLADPDKASYLRKLVGEAESLGTELRKLASLMLAETLPDAQSKDTRERARSIVDAGPLDATYFAHVERALPRVLMLLADDQWEEAESDWRNALQQSAYVAWRQLLATIGRSLRALR